MHYLFEKKFLKQIQQLSQKNTLFAFDFDGTLAKISKNADKATLSRRNQAFLMRLSCLAPVAIISGRGVDDLKKRIDIPDIDLVGNHGLEGIHRWKSKQMKAKKLCQQWLRQLKRHHLGPGIFIENKRYSLSIHFRDSKNKKISAKTIADTIEQLKPSPRIIHGKCVYNIIPAHSPHKGTALLELKRVKKIKKIFYVGDDDTDEDVFKLKNPALLSVRVGKKKTSQAQYYLQRQSEVSKVLETILSFF